MHRWVIFGLFRTGRLRISLGIIEKSSNGAPFSVPAFGW